LLPPEVAIFELAALGEPPLNIVVALHVGTAIYGNIGAANRTNFTVIGSAVTGVSRRLPRRSTCRSWSATNSRALTAGPSGRSALISSAASRAARVVHPDRLPGP
jgi:hypothetical protein